MLGLIILGWYIVGLISMMAIYKWMNGFVMLSDIPPISLYACFGFIPLITAILMLIGQGIGKLKVKDRVIW